MPNKTIYVSEKDASLFEEAKNIAGEALSSVIVRALSEFVTRNQNKQKGMKEVALKIGIKGAESEKRFIGALIGGWQGFSDNKEWYLKAKVYRSQKDNWVIYLETVCKASLLTDKKAWKENGDYLIDPKASELFIGKTPEELKNAIPADLYIKLQSFAKQDENPVEYLDI
jgi:EXLDI family protein